MELGSLEEKVGTFTIDIDQVVKFQYFVSDFNSPNDRLISDLKQFGRRGGTIGIVTEHGKIVWGLDAPEHKELAKNYGDSPILRFQALNEGNGKIELQIHTLERLASGKLIKFLKDHNFPDDSIISVYLGSEKLALHDYFPIINYRSLKSVDPAQLK